MYSPKSMCNDAPSGTVLGNPKLSTRKMPSVQHRWWGKSRVLAWVPSNGVNKLQPWVKIGMHLTDTGQKKPATQSVRKITLFASSLKPGKSSLVRDSWRVTLWKKTINKELGYHAGSGYWKSLFTCFMEYVKLLHLASVFFCICDMLQLRIKFLGLGDGPVDKSVGYGSLKIWAKWQARHGWLCMPLALALAWVLGVVVARQGDHQRDHRGTFSRQLDREHQRKSPSIPLWAHAHTLTYTHRASAHMEHTL